MQQHYILTLIVLLFSTMTKNGPVVDQKIKNSSKNVNESIYIEIKI